MQKRLRSPSYPSIPLQEAIDLAKKIHSAVHSSSIDREAAAKEMGFSGLTGHSGKMLATLNQYGLVEKSGKGDVRVTQRLIDIIHPDPAIPSCRSKALLEAARHSDLFDSLMAQFPNGATENALKSYLTRNGYNARALQPAVSSFLETSQFLQQEKLNFSPTDSQETISPRSDATQAEGPFDSKSLKSHDIAPENHSPQSASPTSEPPEISANRKNTVRVTVDGSELIIHGGVLDIRGVEKLRKELDAYATLLRLNAVEEVPDGDSDLIDSSG